MVELPNRIALVHEWFTPRAAGGSELVVRELDQMFQTIGRVPQLFALVDGESRRPQSWLHGRDIHTSLIQRLPFGTSHVQQYLPLLPMAIEQLDVLAYPLVLSSNHLVAKGVLTSPDQLHVSYVHTPVRYAWDQMHAYLASSRLGRGVMGPWVRWQLHQLRQWDAISSLRVDALIANSRFTARRIQQFWRRNAHVIHPPVVVQRFRWDRPRESFYLSLCRLVPNKRVDLVVQAFNRTKLPLVVIGDGPERHRLETMAGPQIRFLGRCSDSQSNDWLERCRAYVYAGIEDFGIAPVEAMAAGAPIIAYGCGGLHDSVRCIEREDHKPTGLLYKSQDAASLAAALEYFESSRLWRCFPAETQRRWADQFAPERFQHRMLALLEQLWDCHRQQLLKQSTPPTWPVPMG